MRLLVTGGAGYVGSHTCVALLKAAHDVVVIDNFSNAHEEVLQAVRELSARGFEWVEGDIRDGNLVHSVIAHGRFDGIIHFAALKSVPESIDDPLRYWDVNVHGTNVLLREAIEAGIRKFVFSSSAAIYGQQLNVPIAESARPEPLNPYAETKLAGEHILRDLARVSPQLRVCVLRYFNPIGAHISGKIGEDPKVQATNLFPTVLEACLAGLPVNVFGTDYETPDGSAIRDFIHVMDLAAGHAAAIEFLGQVGEREGRTWTFNLGTGRGVSVLELINAMERASGRVVRRHLADKRSGDVAISVADSSRSASILGWRSHYSVDDACVHALRWAANTSRINS